LLGAPFLEKEGVLRDKKESLRAIYLYGVSIVTLVMLVFGIIQFVSGILNIVFLQASEEARWAYSIRNIVRNASLIIVSGIMLFYHWNIVNKEVRSKKEGEKNE